MSLYDVTWCYILHYIVYECYFDGLCVFFIVKGRVLHLFLRSGELKQYLIQTERVLQRYTHRMQWLLSGEHHHTQRLTYRSIHPKHTHTHTLWHFLYLIYFYFIL